MNKLISLALHVGRLEARLEALEKRLEWEPPAPEVHVELGHAATGADPEGGGGRTPGGAAVAGGH